MHHNSATIDIKQKMVGHREIWLLCRCFIKFNFKLIRIQRFIEVNEMRVMQLAKLTKYHHGTILLYVEIMAGISSDTIGFI